MEEFRRFTWEEYLPSLIKKGYTEEQIKSVYDVRENPEYEYMTPDQFNFLVQVGMIKRTVKLKNPRCYYVKSDGIDRQIIYLNHYHKAWNYVGYFVEETESIS